MANPLPVEIPEKTVTKVATDVTNGIINRVLSDVKYRASYRMTGESAPNIEYMLQYGRVIFEESNQEKISAEAGIDVYIYCSNNDDDSDDKGEVVVNL